MANSPQSIKRVRQAARRAKANQGLRTKFRTMVKRARAVSEANSEAEVGRNAFVMMQAVADRAGRKGLVHPRTVSRLKSRINRALRTAKTAATATPAPKA